MSSLVRPNATVRLFPPVDKLYSLESNISGRVLTPPLGRFERVTGWKLTPRGRLARLFLFHREALSSEQAGNWKAADFYFTEILHQLKATPPESEVWDALIELFSPAQRSASDGKQFYSRMVDEIFIDTHCAFYNAYSRLNELQKPDPESRQSVHLKFVTQWLEFSQAPEDVRFAIVGGAMRDRVDAFARAEQWDAAVSGAADLLQAFLQRDEFVQLSADLQFARALKVLSKGDGETVQESNARSLERSIASLEQLRARYPDSVSLYRLISQLYRIRAVNLANAGLPSDALLANQKALAYWPLEEAEKDRPQLEELMSNMISGVKGMVKQLASRPNAYLNAHGLRLKRQADAGFAPASNYAKSDEAKTLSTKSYEARNRDIWKRVGLAPPPDRWPDRAAKLVAGMVRVQEITQDAPEKIESTWRQLVGNDPDLANIEGALIRRFLVARDSPDPPKEIPKPAAPILPVAAPVPPRGKGSEPILYWAFSGQNIGLKVQAGAAIVLVLLAFALTWRQHAQEQIRESAWSRMENAAMMGDDLATVVACETFFSTSPVASDPRALHARDLYRASLVRWFGQIPGDPDANALVHVGRFRELSSKWHDSSDGGAK
jgi:hypothetical protein